MMNQLKKWLLYMRAIFWTMTTKSEDYVGSYSVLERGNNEELVSFFPCQSVSRETNTAPCSTTLLLLQSGIRPYLSSLSLNLSASAIHAHEEKKQTNKNKQKTKQKQTTISRCKWSRRGRFWSESWSQNCVESVQSVVCMHYYAVCTDVKVRRVRQTNALPD